MSALAAAGARSRPRSPRFRSQGSRSRRSPRTSHPHAGPGRPWPGVFSKCGSPSAAAMATAYSLPRPGPSCPLPLPHALPSRRPPRPSRRRVPRLLFLLVSLPARLSFWVLENPNKIPSCPSLYISRLTPNLIVALSALPPNDQTLWERIGNVAHRNR